MPPALPFLKKETLIMMGEDEFQIVPLANGKILEALIPDRLKMNRAGTCSC